MRSKIWIRLALAMAVVGTGALASERRDDADSKGTAAPASPYLKAKGGKDANDGKQAKVYTNEDLSRAAAGTLPRPVSSVKAPDTDPDDPLTWLESKQEEAGRQQQTIAEVEKEVGIARSRVEELETRIRAIRNPLLPRPSAEGKPEGWDRMNSQERIDSTNADLDQAREELRVAEETLRKVKSGS